MVGRVEDDVADQGRHVAVQYSVAGVSVIIAWRDTASPLMQTDIHRGNNHTPTQTHHTGLDDAPRSSVQLHVIGGELIFLQ